MRIKEHEWLKVNKHLLSPEDHKRLEELNVFEHIETGKVDMPLPDYVEVLNELSRIVGKYNQKECKHETIIKVYRARDKDEEGYPKKELVIRCEACDQKGKELLENAKKVIDLTGDDL